MAEIILSTWSIGNTKNNTHVRVVFKLTHKHQRRLISTAYKILPSQFSSNGMIINHTQATEINRILMGKLSGYLGELTKIAGILNDLDIDQVKDKISTPEKKEINSGETGINVFDAFDNYYELLIKTGKTGSARNYKLTKKKLREWWKGDYLDFTSLTYAKLFDFNEYLLAGYEEVVKEDGKEKKVRKNYSVNTISIHERNLRAIFNREIKFDRIPATIYPFRKYKIKDNKDTEHRDLTIEQMWKIRDLDLSGDTERTQEARDLFMLSFYLVGINLTDLWHLNFARIETGIVEYFRKKTNKRYYFSVPPEAVPILNRYTSQAGTFALRDRLKRYDSLIKIVRKGLIAISKKTGIEHLTYYHARHTWSTLAQNKAGVSGDDADLALGHGARKVGDRYNRKDLDRIDIANNKVIALIPKEKYKSKTNDQI